VEEITNGSFDHAESIVFVGTIRKGFTSIASDPLEVTVHSVSFQPSGEFAGIQLLQTGDTPSQQFSYKARYHSPFTASMKLFRVVTHGVAREVLSRSMLLDGLKANDGELEDSFTLSLPLKTERVEVNYD
jgi:hypothetical protein